MASHKKIKILGGAVATTATVATIVVPGGAIGATTVTSDSQTDGTQGDTNTTDDLNNLNSSTDDSNNLNSLNNLNNTNDAVIKTKSNKPEVPYFYYWTSGEGVTLAWDYGHVANRPTKIEAVIDKTASFLNPSYIQVKPKGAEFIPDIDGDFYLRVRFFDSTGNVTHESIRKVIRNSTETRELKGLRHEVSGTGLKISWNNFVEGIKSGQIFVDGQPRGNLSASDIKSNSVVVQNVSEGSEIRIRIVGNNGLEYNGVVIVEKGSLQSTSNINLGLSQDGVGIGVDLSKTSFKKGNQFDVRVVQKDDNDVIVNGTKVTLDKDKGILNIYPDAGKTFLNADYTVIIKDLNTGDVFTYDYSHKVSSAQNFVSAGLSNGEIVSSWNKVDGVVSAQLAWTTSSDFSDFKVVDIGAGKNGVSFNTGLTGENTVYLLLTTYDEQGRVVTQDIGSVVVGNAEGKITEFKGVYKSDDTAEFSWKKLNADITKGILKVNDKIVTLSPSELATLNSTNTLTVGGFKKGNKYEVSLYLLDNNGKVYRGDVSSILTQGTSSDSDVLIDGIDGIIARYTQKPGVLTLMLDEGMYDIAANSSIGILINGQQVSSVSAKNVSQSNSINITGLIPTKEYKNISLSYTNKAGESKTITIPSLTIKRGSTLDSFLVNAYNKAISRDTNNIDEDGYNYWKNGLVSKSITLSYFIRNFAYVPEFMSLVNSPQDLVTRLYHVLVLRDPEPQGLQFWSSVYGELVKNGVSHNEATIKILTDMTTSSEFSNLAERLGVTP